MSSKDDLASYLFFFSFCVIIVPMITLSATKRDAYPSVEAARKAGFVPAVFYGSHQVSTSIFVLKSGFDKAFKQAGESTLITLDIGAEKVTALIHDIQRDPVTDQVIHADFYVVDANEKVQVGVHLVFEGVSNAVKNQGGTLVKVLHDLEVECLPKDLPAHIVVDIAKLETTDSVITVGDLVLPKGVTPTADAEEVVASIAVGKDEDLSAPVAGPDLDAIEVVKKGKKEESAEGEE